MQNPGILTSKTLAITTMAIPEAIRIAKEICRLASDATSHDEMATFVANCVGMAPEVMASLPDSIEAAAKGNLDLVVARYAQATREFGLCFAFEMQLLAKVNADIFAQHYWSICHLDRSNGAEMMLSLLTVNSPCGVLEAIWRRAPFHELASLCQQILAWLSRAGLNQSLDGEDNASVSDLYRSRLIMLRQAGVPLDALCSNVHLALMTMETDKVAVLISELWSEASRANKKAIVRSITDVISQPDRFADVDYMFDDRLFWLRQVRAQRRAMMGAASLEAAGKVLTAP